MQKKITRRLNLLTPGSTFKKRYLPSIFWLFLIIIFVFGIVASFFLTYHQRIYPKIFVGNLNLSGLTKDEALTQLDLSTESFERQGLKFLATSSLGKKTVSIPLKIFASDPTLVREILSFKNEEAVDFVFSIGREGNLIRKIEDLILVLIEKQQIQEKFDLNKKEIKDILKENFSLLEQPAKNASLSLDESGQLILIKEEEGFFFNYSQAIFILEENLKNLFYQPIFLTAEKQEPKIKKNQVNAAFERAKGLLKVAPFTLKYLKDEWQIDNKTFISWLEFIDQNQEINLSLSQEKFFEFLKTIAEKIDIEPHDALFKIEEGRVIEFQTSAPGKKLNFEKSFEVALKNSLSGERFIELIVEKIEPKVLTSDVNELGIKELIGRGESKFSGSPKNRRLNIATGAKKLNGILIAPEEKFSLVKALGEVSEKTGFLPELVIKGNRTIPEYGGGLCQIGTTTFRVALSAGVPILARTPHSYRVIYYEPAGKDATIYNPQPDFVFLNDTPAHILFQTKIEGDNLIFEFYGTSDGRKVEISDSKIYNIVSPPPTQYIETEELPPGEKKKIERAIAGANAEFSQIITWLDGTKKEKIWQSHYKPWPEVWLIGKEPEPEPLEETPEQL